jgi:hypothetical protein
MANTVGGVFPECAGWRTLLYSFSPEDFDDHKGPQTLERVARFALTPTGQPFPDANGQPLIPSVTVDDRAAAIAFLVAFQVCPDEDAEPDALATCARATFRRFGLLELLFRFTFRDTTNGGSAAPPREPLPSRRERLVALALINSLVAVGLPLSREASGADASWPSN